MDLHIWMMQQRSGSCSLNSRLAGSHFRVAGLIFHVVGEHPSPIRLHFCLDRECWRLRGLHSCVEGEHSSTGRITLLRWGTALSGWGRARRHWNDYTFALEKNQFAPAKRNEAPAECWRAHARDFCNYFFITEGCRSKKCEHTCQSTYGYSAQ